LLSQAYRKRMQALGLPGEARTAAVPEREFPYGQAIVASSDQAVMQAARHWTDLAQAVLGFSGKLEGVVDFSALIAHERFPHDFL
jgi:hypothetical protein